MLFQTSNVSLNGSLGMFVIWQSQFFLIINIGTLLLWKSKSRTLDALSCENIYGHKGDEKPDYIVLDGQQRLTAINYAFLAPDIHFPKRKGRVFYFVDMKKLFRWKF